VVERVLRGPLDSGQLRAVVKFGFVDGRLSMLVIPEDCDVDADQLRRSLSAEPLSRAAQAELAGAFPDCEAGAIPPVGTLWKMPVYLDESLLEAKTISFYAGTFSDIISVGLGDYMRVVRPQVVALSVAHVNASRLEAGTPADALAI
jgi:Ala-tRNA(Pro) deacylase